MRSLNSEFSKAKKGDLGVIGDPIGHSLSPVMHNAMLKRRNSPAVYHRFRVRPSELGKALALARKIGLGGLNVTLPHKERALQYLDRVDPFARSVGAVNTIVIGSRGLTGFNTDGVGFEKSLRHDLGFQPRRARVLVLGAGGTGQVIVRQLERMKVRKIEWWNRSGRKIRGRGPRIKNVSFYPELNKMSLRADLIVNATSVGLKNTDGLPAPGVEFKKGQYVFDVVYHRTTAFMRKAKSRGAHVTGGLGMLVYQGAKAFEILTGLKSDPALMRRALMKNL